MSTSSAAPLRALLASAADDGCTGLILDTSRVAFRDSGFLAVLDWWPRQGRRLRLANRSRAVRHLLAAAAPARRRRAHAGSPTAAGRS
ncbi:STAS domain-containing protein [Streptomyces laurentii]|uniref:STAS domain-containing protein n=1 Tax=Streptomyces laurentii TaxID=39478 RepID=UPI0033CE9662